MIAKLQKFAIFHGTKKQLPVCQMPNPIYRKYLKIQFITKLHHNLKKYF